MYEETKYVKLRNQRELLHKTLDKRQKRSFLSSFLTDHLQIAIIVMTGFRRIESDTSQTTALI